MNSTLGNNQSYSFCSNLYKFYNIHIRVSIGVVGTILNFICIVIFYKLIRNSTQKDNLNKYLFIKSIFDTLTYIIIIAQSANYSNSDTSLVYQVFDLIFLDMFYLSPCLSQCFWRSLQY